MSAEVKQVGPRVEAIPTQQLRDPKTPEWGIPVTIAIPREVKFRPGELVEVRFRNSDPAKALIPSPLSVPFDLALHFRQNHSPICSFAIPRTIYRDLGLRFDESLVVIEDWHFFMRAAMLVTDFNVAMESLAVRAELLASWAAYGHNDPVLQSWPAQLQRSAVSELIARWLGEPAAVTVIGQPEVL